MKDDIKEILDNTLEYLEGIDETRNTKILTTNETNILLDYIFELKDYKQRNEKAIEYIIENDDFYYGDELYDGYQEIINILKGDKDD